MGYPQYEELKQLAKKAKQLELKFVLDEMRQLHACCEPRVSGGIRCRPDPRQICSPGRGCRQDWPAGKDSCSSLGIKGLQGLPLRKMLW